ncbi:hypothetical protein GCM10027577_00470 [Spirosoma fluminis]
MAKANSDLLIVEDDSIFMNKLYLLLPLVLLSLITCTKKTSLTTSPPSVRTFAKLVAIDSVITPVDTACHIDGPVIAHAENWEGEVRFTGRSSLYCLVYTVPNATDNQWFGYVCNMPNEFKRSTLKVIFSGKYYHAYKYIKHPGIDGQPQLYLSLERIRMKGL